MDSSQDGTSRRKVGQSIHTALLVLSRVYKQLWMNECWAMERVGSSLSRGTTELVHVSKWSSQEFSL